MKNYYIFTQTKKNCARMTSFVKFLTISVFLIILSNQVAFSQTQYDVPTNNGKLDFWSPECYMKDNCGGEQGSPCTASEVVINSVYVGDMYGNPISPFCPNPGEADLYLWAEFDANTNRYAIRTYY